MSTREAPRRLGVLDLLIAALCVASLVDFSLRWSRILGYHWDISVYARAIADYRGGVEAYRTNNLFPFVYHPLILRVFAGVDALVPLWLLIPVLTVGALVWLSRELQRSPAAIGPGRLLAGLVVAGAFGGIGAPALMSGNMAPFMHLSLMAALLYGRRAAERFAGCAPYVLILLFALVKPYFLLFLVAPVLLYDNRRVALIRVGVVVAVFAVTWMGLGRYVWPEEYARFLRNLQWHILGRGDLGYTFFYLFGALTHKPFLALALHVMVSAVLVALVPQIFVTRYGREVPFAPPMLVLYLVLTMANPRMKDYDLFPALAGFFAVLPTLLPHARPVTLAGLALSAIPLLSAFVPGLSARHPVLFDPFGNWQLVGLGIIGLFFLLGMLDQEPADGMRVPASTPL